MINLLHIYRDNVVLVVYTYYITTVVIELIVLRVFIVFICGISIFICVGFRSGLCGNAGLGPGTTQ